MEANKDKGFSVQTVQDLGRTVDGDINYSTDLKEQHDPMEFMNALDALLQHKGVKRVSWEQYTPYFNDGEACIFSAQMYGGGVKLKFGDDDAGDYENGYYESFKQYDYATRSYQVQEVLNGVNLGDLPEKLATFGEMIDGGHHNNFLLRSFGDHAKIFAKRDGSFKVETYEHD